MQRTDTSLHYQRLHNEIAAYMENNTATPLGITELADHLCISYHHLADIFRTTRGESLGHYITRTKLEKAAMLSAYTKMNLSEIADATGFATKHSLSKAFSNHFNFYPGKASASLLRTDSINAIMDGITSKAHYQYIVESDFPFTYREQTITNGVLVGYTSAIGALPQPFTHSMPYINDLLSITTTNATRRCIKAFDSVNFSPLKTYREFYGIFTEQYPTTKEQHRDTDAIILPVPKGTYLVFNAPADNKEDIKHHITRFRENLIGHKKLFTLHHFYDFFLLNNNPNAGGEYYIFSHA